MKLSVEIFTKLQAVFFGAAVLLTCSDSLAQVKVGTNPTAIEAASNLEVEASTSSRKMKIDKTSGQLTLKDGTEGTAKVLTSDAVGGASWQLIGTPNISQLPKAKLIGANTPNLPYAGNTTILFSGVEFTEGGMTATGTSNAITVATAGYYTIILNISVNNTGCAAKTSIVSAAGAIRVNGRVVQGFDDKITVRSDEGSIFNVPVLAKLKAGDGISASMDNMFFTTEAGCVTKVTGGSLSAHYQP